MSKSKQFGKSLSKPKRFIEDLIIINAAEIAIKSQATCPFCGCTPKKLIPAHGSFFHENRGVQVECINCGARGPIYGDPDSAFRAWREGEHDYKRADFKK